MAIPPPPPPPPQAQHRRVAIAIAIALSLIVLCALALYLMFFVSDNQTTPTRTPTSSASLSPKYADANESDTPSDTPTEWEPTPSSDSPEAPNDIFTRLSQVPDSLDGFVLVAEMYRFSDYGFKTPSGNIFCYFNNGKHDPAETGKLGCEMTEFADVRPEDIPARDVPDISFHGGTVSIGPSEVTYGDFRGGATEMQICGIQPELDFCDLLAYVTTLDYGQAIRHGDIACLSEETGLTCVSLSQGKGVWVNRSDYGYIFR